MNKNLIYTIITDSESLLYPPLTADEASDFIAFTNIDTLTSEYWDVHFKNDLALFQEDIIRTPESFLPGYDNYIYVASDEIIFGRLSENNGSKIKIPSIKSMLPEHIKLMEPQQRDHVPNPVYTKGPYNGYPLQLSICLPISNRKDSLRKCLDSLKPLLEQLESELIVVDTSNDGSTEIAKEYGAKIIPFVWCGDFSKARNAAIQKASGAWILSIDDDEWFDDTTEIISFFKSSEWKKYDIGLYNVRNYSNFEGVDFNTLYVQRMIRNHRDLHYIHTVHETFDLTFIGGSPKTKYFSAFVHHYGYAYRDEAERQNKVYRNVSSMYTALKEAPFNLRLHYQLANELTIIKQFNGSAAYCLKLIALSKLQKKLASSEMVWVQTAITYLYIVGYLSGDKSIFDIAVQFSWKNFDCFKCGTIQYVLTLHSFNSSDYKAACEYAEKYYLSRKEFLQLPNRTSLASCLSMDLVSTDYRTNAIYIVHAYCLLETDHEDESANIFSKINLNFTKPEDLPILAKMSYSFSKDNFTKIFDSVEDSLIAALFTHIKKLHGEKAEALEKDYSKLYDKISCCRYNADNEYLHVIKLYAEPDNPENYRWFYNNGSALVKFTEDVSLCLFKHRQPVSKLLSMLKLEGIQQMIRTLSSIPFSEFTDIFSFYLDRNIINDGFVKLTAEEVYLFTGLLESYCLNMEVSDTESEQSALYLEFFRYYTTLLNRWTTVNYNASMLDEKCFSLLPATCRGGSYMAKAFESADDTESYMKYIKAAVSECPLFDRGAKLLLSQLKEQPKKMESDTVSKPKTEFELLGEQLKAAAKQLISSGSFQEAQNILVQLSNLMPGDKEVSELLKSCTPSNLPN